MRRIFLLGEIAEWGCSPAWLLDQMRGIGPDEPLELHVDSPGGDTFGGFSMANLLKTHRGPKTCVVDGECSSAATFPALACDRVLMRPLSMMLIHHPWVQGASGTAAALDKHIQTLDAMSSMCVELYRNKTGADEQTVRGWMAADAYLTPQQALQMRLCDEILTDAPSPAEARALDQARVQVRAQAQAYLAKRRPPAAAPVPTSAPAPKAAAPAPSPPKTRIQSMDRMQMIEMWAAACAQMMRCCQMAAESPEADLQMAAGECLADGCMPMMMEKVMSLAKAAGMDEEMAQAKAKTIHAVYAAAQRVTGVKDGLVGALEALQNNANAKAAPAAASVDVAIEAEIQRGIKLCKILPAQAAGWRSNIASGDRTLADLKSFVTIALPAAPKASSEQVHGAAIDLETTVVDPAVADMIKDL